MGNRDYLIKLDVFEGPMDLLVHLIRKAEVEIYDIPIAMITDQFLEYIDWMKSMSIDFAGDFLVMASTLTHIKSKMLLPMHEDDEDDEDPRMEIIRPLEEYLQIKEATEDLVRRNLLGQDTFTRLQLKADKEVEQEEGMIKVGLFELIDAFQRILDNISPDHRIELAPDRISVKERINEIVSILEDMGSATFEELFSESTAKSGLIVTFLAILEMAKMNLLRIAQHVQTGVIRLFYL